jgi:hypothetical protein
MRWVCPSCHGTLKSFLMKELQGIARHLHWLIPFNSSYTFLSIYIQRAVNYNELTERIEIFCLFELNSLICYVCSIT